jgi:hypothetical protein
MAYRFLFFVISISGWEYLHPCTSKQHMYQPKVGGLQIFKLNIFLRLADLLQLGQFANLRFADPIFFSRAAKLRFADLQFADQIFVEDLKLP